MTDMKEALKWALEHVHFLALHHHQPDDPFWNDYRRAAAILDGRDPDNQPEN